jgi:ribonuclease BN (tRNA processing enzyme)
MSDDIQRERRTVLAAGLRLAGFVLLPGALSAPLHAQLRAEGLAAVDAPPPPPPMKGTRLVLLGTRGGPGIDLTRSQTASAVVVDGVPYLVDCGYGTLRQLVASRVGYLRVGQVFLTHLHDDHTADLPALLSFQWTNNRAETTEVFGPYGTGRLVEAAIASFRGNVEIRTIDEGRVRKPEALYHGHDIDVSATPVQVFKDERVTVTAIENTHFPARSTARMPHRALALRFDTRERSIVFSGDTAYSANIVKLAKGADLFVCEIMDDGIHTQMLERAKAAAAQGNTESIFRHIAETHSAPADVARMASEAGVHGVVLNHLLPGVSPPNGLDYATSAFIDGVRKGYTGEVIVGQDLMVL